MNTFYIFVNPVAVTGWKTDKNMRRFRFVGDPESYKALGKGYPFIVGKIYTDDTVGIGCIVPVGVYSSHELSKRDWVEVFDDEEEEDIFDAVGKYRLTHTEKDTKLLHKDTDLGYFAGLAMQAFISSPDLIPDDFNQCSEWALSSAKSLIEALDKEVGNG